MYICVEGNIGAGKTTFVKSFAEINGFTPIFERFTENPFLKLFYENPTSHAFPLEMSFLAERFQQLNDLFSKPNLFEENFIADYSFLKTLIFSEINLLPEEFEVFKSFHKLLRENIRQPDYFIYLNVSTELALRNINNRNRTMELDIEEKYLNSIRAGYQNWMLNQNNIPVVIVDYNQDSWTELQQMASNIFSFLDSKPDFGNKIVWE